MSRGRPKGTPDSYRRFRSTDPVVSASTTVRRIFGLMEELRRTAGDVAIDADICRASMSCYKNGKRTPSILTVEELAAALGYEIKLVKKENVT